MQKEFKQVSRSNSTEGNMKEVNTSMNRENNIVLYNMTESESNDIQQRICDDVEEVMGILDYLQINGVTVMKVRRLGKRKEDKLRPRPMLVSFQNSQQKWLVLKNSKHLKDSPLYFSIFMAKDMNKEEQENDAKIRHELISRRKNNESVMIKNSQVIRKKKEAQLRDYLPERGRRN